MIVVIAMVVVVVVGWFGVISDRSCKRDLLVMRFRDEISASMVLQGKNEEDNKIFWVKDKLLCEEDDSEVY